MSVEKKIQTQKYALRPRRKSSGNVVQTIVTVHEGHLPDKSGKTNDVTTNNDMERLPSKFLHSPKNGRRLGHANHTGSHPQLDILAKGDETLSISSSTSSFGYDDVFMELPVRSEGNHRPVALEEELQAHVHQLSGLLTMWKKRCQEQKQHNSGLVQQLQGTQSEYKSLMEHTREKYHKQLQSVRTELTRVTAVKDKLEKEYTDMQASFRKSLEQNKMDMEKLHGRWKQRNSEIEKLRVLNMQSRDEIDKLQGQVEKLKSENKNLFKVNRELQGELTKLKTERELKNNNTTCSCMGQEYRLLFELALSKIKTFESEHSVISHDAKRDCTSGNDALLRVEKDLQNLATRGSSVENTTNVHYFSDSFDSCDSPQSSPSSPALKSKVKKIKSIHQRKFSESSKASRTLSSFSFNGVLSATSGYGSLGNITGHVTHPLDMQTPRDLNQGYRQRAYSDVNKGAKRFPLNKSYTTDDSRITDLQHEIDISPLAKPSDHDDVFERHDGAKTLEKTPVSEYTIRHSNGHSTKHTGARAGNNIEVKTARNTDWNTVRNTDRYAAKITNDNTVRNTVGQGVARSDVKTTRKSGGHTATNTEKYPVKNHRTHSIKNTDVQTMRNTDDKPVRNTDGNNVRNGTANGSHRANGSAIPVEIHSGDDVTSSNEQIYYAPVTSRKSSSVTSPKNDPVTLHDTPHSDVTSGFGGLRSRRNGITAMPLDVSVQLRMNDVKKSKEFSDLLKKFTKEKDKEVVPEKKFSAIRRLSRKKSKPSEKPVD